MPKALDLTGQKFGKLTVLSKSPSRNGKTYWLCKCECGIEKEVQTSHLRSGSIQSCGSVECKTIKTQQYKKICPICKKEFITSIKTRLYCYDCSPSQLENKAADYQKAKKRAIKHQLILYKGGKCELCGYNKCEGALQFHHIDAKDKEFTISHINLNQEIDMQKLFQEIDKCQLLCANCHAEKHYS